MENIIEFCELNRNVITDTLAKKGIVIENSEQFKTGVREIMDRNYNCTVVEDKRIACVMAKQMLKNHRLPYKIINIDFTFTLKKHSINIGNEMLYYKYCVL